MFAMFHVDFQPHHIWDQTRPRCLPASLLHFISSKIHDISGVIILFDQGEWRASIKNLGGGGEAWTGRQVRVWFFQAAQERLRRLIPILKGQRSLVFTES